MAAELMITITHLSALYPGAFLLELRAKQPNGELHYQEQFSHIVRVVQRAFGQDSIHHCEKCLSRCHKAQDEGIKSSWIFFCLKDIFVLRLCGSDLQKDIAIVLHSGESLEQSQTVVFHH